MADNFSLALKYFEKVFGQSIDNIKPVELSGWEVVEIIWPLNNLFRPKWRHIRSVKYRIGFEKEADKAIEDFVVNPVAGIWDNLADGTWRVLLERYTQLIQLALANELADNPVTYLPEGLPKASQLCGLMILLLHSMKLPWPPGDRSHLEKPAESPPESLRLH